MGNTISLDALLNRKYSTYPLSPEWVSAIGAPEVNFKAVVFGFTGSGKTTLVLQMCREFARLGRVYYNSIEQGEGKSLQDVVKLVEFPEEVRKNIKFGNKDTFEEMVHKIETLRAKFVVIDSRDFMNLTTTQYKMLVDRFPRIAFIIICWEGSGEKPKSEFGKSMLYMADIKIHVKNGVAIARSRFGATKPYKIFER